MEGRDHPGQERKIPSLPDLYEDLKDKYIMLTQEFIRARKINKDLQKENEKLLIRAKEAERMINERLLQNVRQSAADEGLDPRQAVIDKYLNKKQ